MTVHFEWKVLFRTTEAQLAHNLGALWSAEMLPEAALRRAHPLFGTARCRALHSSLPAARLCHPHTSSECALWHRGGNRPIPFFLPLLQDYQVYFAFNSLYAIGGKIYAGLSLLPKFLLDSKNSVYLSGGGGHRDCKLRGWCSNPADQHKALRILFLLQLQVTAKERVGGSHSVNRNVSLHLLLWTLQTRTNSCNCKVLSEKLIPICFSSCLQLFLMGGSSGSSMWSF